VTLHSHGITDVQSSEQAAEALRPIAGEYAFLLFAAGIIDTGLLAVPVLAGSAAYAVAESFKWHISLGRPPLEAQGFWFHPTQVTSGNQKLMVRRHDYKKCEWARPSQ
jgi:Mn2+/Fe2+ NRAMP family transporter